ncbi:MAG: GDP-mannose 4,6-dehydratase [Candidatus Komeilibacteria bacterium]|nr:GDP-mannose 4,6-dehydratase [Candidatus Komeilibacteria bacterium]
MSELKNKVLIITGGAGFIGLNFLLAEEMPSLASRYQRVIAIDKLGYAAKYNQVIYSDACQRMNIEMINKNIIALTDIDLQLTAEDEIDIVDFASESHVDNSIARPYDIYNENALLPSALLAAIGSWQNIKRYYHISTDEVYGDLPLNAAEFEWFDVNTSLNPQNPYSASKAAQDHFLLAMKHTFGLPVSIIRMANQFGPYQHPEKMIPASLQRVWQQQPVKIYGQGQNKRQWTPVKATVKLILQWVIAGEEFDIKLIADQRGLLSNNELMQRLQELLQKKFSLSMGKEYVTDRLGHDLMYALRTESDIDQAFASQAWDLYLGETIDFYWQNKDSYNI